MTERKNRIINGLKAYEHEQSMEAYPSTSSTMFFMATMRGQDCFASPRLVSREIRFCWVVFQ